MLFQLYKTDFWQFKAAVLNNDISVYAVGRVAFSVAFLGLEFRKTCFRASEKVVVCRLQVHLSVSQSKTVHLFQPWGFSLVLCRCIVQLLLCFLIMLDFIRQHPIVNKPYTAKGFGKHYSLFCIWVYSEFICLVQCFSP